MKVKENEVQEKVKVKREKREVQEIVQDTIRTFLQKWSGYKSKKKRLKEEDSSVLCHIMLYNSAAKTL